MQFLISFLLLSANYQIVGDEPNAWPNILAAIGMTPGNGRIAVIPAGTHAAPEVWLPKIAAGSLVILEGESPLAEALGVHPTSKKVMVRSITDLRRPKLPIIWERGLELPVFTVPTGAIVFSKERWEGAPVMVGMRHGQGAILWLAASAGKLGYERFPYIPQALTELGMEAPYESNRLWAFFDTSYRQRADVDYLAGRWRRAGIAALHVAAWQHYDADPERDAYLKRLIEACHRNAILVYAWLELPHVSEKFWNSHPQWREKTAIGQDAHLDWRKLMNLNNADCAKAVTDGVRSLISRHEWDGVNLAELYFESLEGMENPARFTPMNADVRARFLKEQGFDPIELFGARAGDAVAKATFLNFRAGLAKEMQETWLGEMALIRRTKPYLDLVLTHVDDRFDTRMRDLIGADAARLLPQLDKQDFTFLIEDPATIWHLGPQRYPQIADRYKALTPHQSKLAIDINIVDRYQDVYPTKQQTGVELFQLLHVAAKAFPRVALYFENSIVAEDLPLVASASAVVTRYEVVGGKTIVESPHGVGIPWNSPAMVNGKLWPVRSDKTIWLPPGAVAVEPTSEDVPLHIVDFNGQLRSASVERNGVTIAYHQASRAIAIVDREVVYFEIDGMEVRMLLIKLDERRFMLMLPGGQHVVWMGVK